VFLLYLSLLKTGRFLKSSHPPLEELRINRLIHRVLIRFLTVFLIIDKIKTRADLPFSGVEKAKNNFKGNSLMVISTQYIKRKSG
jgi:hypothetical protein